MKRPVEPKKPIAPEKEMVCTSIDVNIEDGDTVEEVISKGLNNYRGDYVSGTWTISHFWEDYNYDERIIYAQLKGGEVRIPNLRYDEFMERHKRLEKEYEEKMVKYQADMKIYEEVNKSRYEKSLATRKKSLETQMARLDKEMKKLNK